MTVKDFRPLRGCRRKAALETTPCITHPYSPSFILSCSQALVSWRQIDETLMSEKKVSLLNKTAQPP